MPSAKAPVTIIIPAYNAEATLKRAVSSALEQDASVQIIVADDGSNDATLAIAQSFGPPVIVLSGPNQGPAAARNRGLEAAAGEWTIFLDADDELLSGTVEKRLRVAAEVDASVVICDWEEEYWGEEGRSAAIRQFDWEAFALDPELATATGSWAAIHSIMYRTHSVRELGFQPHLRVAEDARLIFDCARAGLRFAHSAHVGARYRFVQGSQSRASHSRFWANVFKKNSEIMEEWKGSGCLTAERRAALANAFYCCERAFFSLGDPLYFDAYAIRRSMGAGPPMHSRVAMPLARMFGQHTARKILSLAGRG